MKKTKITFEIEEEKLSAINLYNKDSENTLEKVINDTIENHYKAVVPDEVRFYLESRPKSEKSKPKKKKSPEIPKFVDKKPTNTL